MIDLSELFVGFVRPRGLAGQCKWPEQCRCLREAPVIEIRPRGLTESCDPQNEGCPNCTSTSIDAYLSRATDVTAASLAADRVLAMDSLSRDDE